MTGTLLKGDRTQTETQERPSEGKGKDGHPQAKERGLRGNQSCWRFDLRLLASTEEKINSCCGICYGSPSKLINLHNYKCGKIKYLRKSHNNFLSVFTWKNYHFFPISCKIKCLFKKLLIQHIITEHQLYARNSTKHLEYNSEQYR